MELAKHFDIIKKYPQVNRKEQFTWHCPDDFKELFTKTLKKIREDYPEELKKIDIKEGNEKGIFILNEVNRLFGSRDKIKRGTKNIIVNLTEIMEINNCLQYTKYLETYRSVLDKKLSDYGVSVFLEKRNFIGDKEDFCFKFKLPTYGFLMINE